VLPAFVCKAFKISVYIKEEGKIGPAGVSKNIIKTLVLIITTLILLFSMMLYSKTTLK
jgi:hypothetical protein